ncbi:MAG: hypothetical protein Q7S15_00940 [bacterium]|nr:hypothetical protein [bacterium]
MNYLETYAYFLRSKIAADRPLRVVFDASNGVTGLVLKDVFNKGEIEPFIINDEIDPEFSAHGPNPLAQGAALDCQRAVKENSAACGVIFDADGDRAIFVDEKGRVVPSYVIAVLLFKHGKPPFVADELIYQSLKLLRLAESVIPSPVGAHYVKEAMRTNDASFGAEFSGHFYFEDFFFQDSGIVAAIHVINILSECDVTLSQFWDNLPRFILTYDEVSLTSRTWMEIEPFILDLYAKKAQDVGKRDGVTLSLHNQWINIRPSNTEPLLRMTAGGESEKDNLVLIQEIKNLVSKK